MSDDFKFDLAAKRTRLSDEDLMRALQAAAEVFGESYFSTTQYEGLSGKRPHPETCESFMKTLKCEEVYRSEYRNLAEARARIGEFLEEIYNQKRLHSSLGYCPPAEFERRQPSPVLAVVVAQEVV